CLAQRVELSLRCIHSDRGSAFEVWQCKGGAAVTGAIGLPDNCEQASISGPRFGRSVTDQPTIRSSTPGKVRDHPDRSSLGYYKSIGPLRATCIPAHQLLGVG